LEEISYPVDCTVHSCWFTGLKVLSCLRARYQIDHVQLAMQKAAFENIEDRLGKRKSRLKYFIHQTIYILLYLYVINGWCI
jgi:hypothetical protein